VSDLADAPLARLARFPREPDILCYAARAAFAAATRLFLRAYHRFEIVGRENLPTDGRSYVLIANHASHLDGLCLTRAWCFTRLDDLESARRLTAAALPHVSGGDYAGEHWLASFAVLALSAAALKTP